RRGFLPLERLLSELDLVAGPCSGGAKNRLELVLRRRHAGDPEATLGAVDAERTPRGSGAVDEEVDERVGGLVCCPLDLLWHMLEERVAQLIQARPRCR